MHGTILWIASTRKFSQMTRIKYMIIIKITMAYMKYMIIIKLIIYKMLIIKLITQ